MDPEHRDDGSLLTLSLLLSKPELFEGGVFSTFEQGERVEHPLSQGEAVPRRPKTRGAPWISGDLPIGEAPQRESCGGRAACPGAGTLGGRKESRGPPRLRRKEAYEAGSSILRGQEL